MRKVRDALDEDGFERVKIVVVRRLHVDEIGEFEEKGVPGRRVRRRLVADPRLERLHRRHRAHRRATLREGRPALPAEPAARARRRDAAARRARGPTRGRARLRQLVHARDRPPAAPARRRSRGRERVAETGTGVGVGAAWIVSALDPSVPFFTAELDDGPRGRGRASSSADDENVHVLAGDWHDAARRARAVRPALPRRLEAAHRRSTASATLGLLAPSGLIVLDDLTRGPRGARRRCASSGSTTRDLGRDRAPGLADARPSIAGRPRPLQARRSSCR